MTGRSRIRTSDPVLAYAGRARAWIFTGLALGLAAGLGLYLLTAPSYRATVAVEVSEVAPMVDLSPTRLRVKQVTVDTDAQILASDEVVTAVGEAAGDSTAQARAQLVIAARPLTRILDITYTASSAAEAAAGAEQGAETFLAERDRLVIAPVEDYLRHVINQTRDPTPASELLATANLSKTPEHRPEGFRQRAVTARLELSGAGRVLEHARTSSSPDRGDIEVPLASGAALGALLGFWLGFARDRGRRGRRPSGSPTAEPRSIARVPVGA